MENIILFVATDGNDSHDGSDYPIDALLKRGPLANLQTAFNRLKTMYRKGMLHGQASIMVHGGIYHISKPLLFSGTFPVTISGCQGEKAIVDGGVMIRDWRETMLNGKKVWKSKMPSTINWKVNQLFVNGNRKTVAAFPKNNFFRVEDQNGEWDIFPGTDHFKVRKGDFNTTWHDPEGIGVLLIHKWIEEHLTYRNYDEQSDIFYSSTNTFFAVSHHDAEYRFENVREALTEPGEFYFDRITKEIYYLPEKGDKIDKTEVVTPLLGNMLRIEGEPDKKQYAQWINIENMTFQHGGAFLPELGPNYDLRQDALGTIPNHAIKFNWKQFTADAGQPLYQAGQAAAQLPGCIILYAAKDCSIRNCTIEHGGWYALDVNAGCSNIRLEHNTIRDLGGGGIRITGADIDTVLNERHPELQTHHVRVTDNHIYDCGKIHLSACGILVLHSFGNLIEHNHIHDLFYSGISCGWSWGFGDSITRENRIGWNHIHDLGKGILSDMGGIYLLGIQPGTRIYNNLIADIQKRYYGGWGLYADEGSSHIVFENNICTDCSCEGFHQHFGRENMIRNNIFAFCADAALAITHGRAMNKCYEFPGDNISKALSVTTNIFVSDGKPMIRAAFADVLEKQEIICESNCYFDVSGGTFQVLCGNHRINFKKWKSLGFDVSSVICDPGFRNIRRRDFRLKNNSILKSINFHEIDLTDVGIRSSSSGI